jgi:hypothetical protein
MISVMSPLPSAMTLLIPASWLRECRSFSPLPSNAFAALSMKRPTELVAASPLGPRSEANLSNCSLTSSHSTGTAVSSWGMTAPSAMAGPELPPGVSCTNRAETRFWATTTAFASEDTRMPWSTSNVKIACVASGWIAVMVPTLTPAMRTSSPG